MTLGHRIFIALRNKRLWNASISFCNVSVSVHISELNKKMLAMYALNVLIFSCVLIRLDLKMFSNFSRAVSVRPFLLLISDSVSSNDPSNLHFFQSGCGFSGMGGL